MKRLARLRPRELDGADTGGTLLVCVSSSPTSAALVRAAQRTAERLHLDWVAAHAETAATAQSSKASDKRVDENLKLAEQLGARTVRLYGADLVTEVLRYAREHDIRTILVGRPGPWRLPDVFAPSFVTRIVRASYDVDIHVAAGDTAGDARDPKDPVHHPTDIAGYFVAALVVAGCTGLSFVAFGQRHLADATMLFTLGIVTVAIRFSRGASIAAAVLSVLALDYFFIPPFYSFDVEDSRSVWTLAVMFVVGVVITGMAKRIKDQAFTSGQREMRTERLYAMTRELASTPGIDTLLGTAVRHLRTGFDAKVVVMIPNDSGNLEVATKDGHTFNPEGDDREVAEWVWKNERAAGLGTAMFSTSRDAFLLLHGSHGKVGILGVRPTHEGRRLSPDQFHMLEAFATQVASALERAQFAEQAQRARVDAEAERLRSSLLSSVSHDLRTPLGVIKGATSTLLQEERFLDVASRRDLIEIANEEAERLDHLVRNLLDMTRLIAGRLSPKKEWHPLEAIIGVALNRLESRLGGREVKVLLMPDIPPVLIDAVLVEQVLVNLLENAMNHTPEGSPIEISADSRGNSIEVEVADRGPGVPLAERDRIFEKFYSLKLDSSDGGTGLGLAICRGVVDAHGGRIWVESRIGGGACFRFSLPVGGDVIREMERFADSR